MNHVQKRLHIKKTGQLFENSKVKLRMGKVIEIHIDYLNQLPKS